MSAASTASAPRTHPRSLRVLVLGFDAVAACALVVSATASGPRPLGDPPLFLAFLVLFVVEEVFPQLLPHGPEAESLRLEEAFLAAMAFLLPPFAILVIFAVGIVLGDMVRKREPIKLLFNAGQMVASAAAALLVIELLPAASRPDPWMVGEVVAGLVTFFLVNSLAVSTVIGLAQGSSIREAFWSGFRPRAIFWLAATSIGLLAGVAAVVHRWTLGLGAVTTVALHVAFSSHLRAVREHRRVESLLASADRIHASMGDREIHDALLDVARDLLRSPEARLTGEPPSDGELGAEIPIGAQRRWLVVRGRRQQEAYGRDDRLVLSALAAIGATALENASLFEERGRLVARLVDAQEKERRRIASDIHDDSIQAVTAVAIRLGTLRRQLGDGDHGAAVSAVEETVRLAVERLRTMMFELRPPSLDREGLGPALREFLAQEAAGGGPLGQVEDALTNDPPEETRANLYRIAQEALVNVRKHAAAATVRVVLTERAGGYLVEVRDDGRGFDLQQGMHPRPGHIGLVDMRERAEMAGGWLRIHSAPGQGTRVEVWLPGARQPATV